MILIADRIKNIRESHHLTQSQLAKQIGISRAGVNAWEMGISIPSPKYLVALSSVFHVSTDFLLGIDNTSTLDVSGLTEKDKELILSIIDHLRDR